MEKIIKFVSSHLDDDTTRLILDRDRWPGIDMELAVNCIESRRKLKGKIREWYDNPELVFPVRLSAEQCSSSMTARYKSSLPEYMTGLKTPRIADLTGGLGVDSWFFSKSAEEILYNEMNPVLCKAARHNFQALGAGNITISCRAAVPSCAKSDPEREATPEELLKDFRPDIVFMDPARRSESGRKVFLIEDCSPDVLKLKEEIFTYSRHVLLKLSPMADISMVCERLGPECREVHVVAAGGECKELLIMMDREWRSGYSVTAVQIGADGGISRFTFLPSEERDAVAPICGKDFFAHPEDFTLFEPGKALMKAGAFNLLSSRYGMLKFGRSTHYYCMEGGAACVPAAMGKSYRILKCMPLDKRSIRSIASGFPKAEVTARNIPMDSDILRKRLGVKPGDEYHVFGLGSDCEGAVLLVTRRI